MRGPLHGRLRKPARELRNLGRDDGREHRGDPYSRPAMYTQAKSVFAATLAEIESAGLWKHERTITSPQAAHIQTNGKEVVNFCANNYLGLSSHPRVIAAARKALEDRGYGLSSVRFICGTQDRHKELEASVSTFLATEDTILYGSCFDANGGLF